MIVFLMLLTLGSSGEEWYKVNSLGQTLRAIPWYQQKDYEWVLKREVKEFADTLHLYKNGTAVERRERELYGNNTVKHLSIYKNEVLVEEEFYDPLGKLLRSIYSDETGMLEELEYQYREKSLVKVFSRKDGNLLYTDEFFRTPDQRLRRVIRTDTDGEKSYYQWIYGPDGLLGEWTDAKNLQALRIYTPEGKLVLRDDLKDYISLGRREWNFQDPQGKSTEILGPVEKAEYLYDAQGRVIRKEIYVKDLWTGTQQWTYQDDVVVREERFLVGKRESWDFTRDENGNIRQEIYSVNGEKVTLTTYEKNLPVQEEIFSQGKKILEVEYSNGVKTKETYYSDDKILRIRELD